MSHTPEFRMSIDITLRGGSPSDIVNVDLIQAALAEVTNRLDFGTKEQTGRVLDHSYDHSDKSVTVDITYVDARHAKGARPV